MIQYSREREAYGTALRFGGGSALAGQDHHQARIRDPGPGAFRIERDPKAHGRRDLEIHSTNRVIVVTAYVSRPLKTLYVLGFHLQRAKEPTKHQTETMKAYVAEIQKLKDSLLKRHRRDLLEVKKEHSPRRRLADNLLALRTKAKLSQAAVAKKAKVGLATYQRIEQCQPTANPGLDVLEKLAEALGVKFEQLWLP
jgi:DNA-binding XRE family transcriptional regulator